MVPPAPPPTSQASGAWSFDAASLHEAPRDSRLLLVDDDELVLRALRRALNDPGLEVVCVSDPQRALEAIDTRAVDVVISDMQMHSMSGAALLGAVQERHPDIARIILSGHADPKQALRAVPFAHQFLAKPIDTDVLKWTVRRACGLRTLLTCPAIRSVVGGSNDLPAAPATFFKLQNALRGADISLSEIAAIIEQDVGIAARLLQLVSSAFFGIPKRVTTIGAAVGFLGVDTIRVLVLNLEIVRMFREGAGARGFSVTALQKRCFAAARIAKAIAGAHAADDAFMGGMLHAVGQLVLAGRVPERYSDVLARAAKDPRPLRDVERDVLGATHGEVAGYLLGLWGLPQRVVEAVTHYHEPWRFETTRLGLTGAIYVGSVLAADPEAPVHFGSGPLHANQLNGAFLDQAGALGALPSWRALARNPSS